MLNHEKQLHLEIAIVDTTHARAFGGGNPAPSIAANQGRNRLCWSIARTCHWCFELSRPIAVTTAKSCPQWCPSLRWASRSGRPRPHPTVLYADTGFDCETTRTLLRWLGIEPHIRHAVTRSTRERPFAVKWRRTYESNALDCELPEIREDFWVGLSRMRTFLSYES